MNAPIENIQTVAYLFAAILFVVGIGSLSDRETAKRGNALNGLGMLIAIGATLLSPSVESLQSIAIAVIVGAALGGVWASRVAMTSMPQMVAILNSFGGLAAVLVGFSTVLAPTHEMSGAEAAIHLIEVAAGVLVGTVTFVGSVVAWAKLEGRIGGKPLLLPGRNLLNGALFVVACGLSAAVLFVDETTALQLLVAVAVVSALLGAHTVLAIGGADMPVVVSLLNSYSGWAASAAGFMLGNDLLIVTGALVGSSGAILTYVMCKAMNRSLMNVVFGGFGATPTAPTGGGAEQHGEVQPTTADQVAGELGAAKRVLIVPGYGMAVAQAQHTIHALTRALRDQGVEVAFGIHPVAGRMPGHMNVLLAEAGIPYDIVFEMDEVNPEMQRTDVVMVVGGNDIVNSGANDDPGSPIYGMPVIEVWNAKRVVVLKRGMSAGYAGVENPLFFKENTRMLFGDARESIEKLVALV